MISRWRFVVATLLLAGTVLLLRSRNSAEIIPAREPLQTFPHAIQSWSSPQDIPLSKDVLDVLGPGDFLMRNYHDSASGADVDLFIAYFPSQKTGDTIHSPKNCLPGAGWSPVRSDRIALNISGHEPFPVNRYLIARGEDRRLVLYWYWAHNRAVASEYSAKFYLIADSIRMHRSDGSLIRVTTRLAPDETIDSAHNRLVSFASNVVPVVNSYVPR
jgi:EpsI family protein